MSIEERNTRHLEQAALWWSKGGKFLMTQPKEEVTGNLRPELAPLWGNVLNYWESWTSGYLSWKLDLFQVNVKQDGAFRRLESLEIIRAHVTNVVVPVF